MPIFLNAQGLLPPINNYKIFEYKADGKNWGVSLNEEGELFVANNKGLLNYNGEEWRLYELPNKTTIRSVGCIGDRIYTGSYEEFGFWKKNDIGTLEYNSLTHLIKNHEFTSEEFWQIVPFGDTIVFRSFSTIYFYENDEIKVLNPSFVVSNIVVDENQLLVAGHKGIFKLKDNKLTPLESAHFFSNRLIVDIIPLNKGLFVGTKLNGCYLLKDKELIPWDSEINEELKTQQLNKIIKLSNGKIAFGTIKNGVYLYDDANEKVERLNRNTGLQNNTVLSISEFKEQLWVGLDNGIDRVQLNTPITYYIDYSGTIGTVYDVAVLSDIVYLGSNTGIYYIKNNELHFIEGSQGHVWDLEVLDGTLICGHNTGSFIIENETLTKISDFTGGYQLVSLPKGGGSYLQGTYTGLSKFSKNKSNSWSVNTIKNINFPVKQLCFENSTTLWAAHPYKGLYRMTLNDSYDSILTKQRFTTKDIPSSYNAKVYNIKNQIVIQSEGIWHKYDAIADKILKLDDFQRFNDKKLLYHDENYFWFIDDKDSRNILYTDLRKDSLVISEPQMRKRLVPDAENMIKLNDSIYYFTLGDGFSCINLRNLNSHLNNHKTQKTKLSFFRDNQNSYSIKGNEPIELLYKTSRNITIQVASPTLINPKYYYTLNGLENKSAYVDNGTINFQNLSYGSYELLVSTVGIDNKKNTPIIVDFKIAPPWYFSRLSLLGYIFVLLGVIYAIRLYNRWKLNKKHKALKEKMFREHEEKLIVIEKEKLAKEIKLKQKELTNITLNIAKKNEVILEVKSLLLANQNNFSNKQQYNNFVKKLNTSINEEDDWKSFEMNFNELHDDFFENLLKTFPSLTPKDLKLAAYLKMNLASKEIAPLMAISTRGVEIHRYRLRKKLGIDASQNITNYLITFK